MKKTNPANLAHHFRQFIKKNVLFIGNNEDWTNNTPINSTYYAKNCPEKKFHISHIFDYHRNHEQEHTPLATEREKQPHLPIKQNDQRQYRQLRDHFCVIRIYDPFSTKGSWVDFV